jgi:hypothetical protein
MTRTLILFSFLFVACGNEGTQPSKQTVHKLPQTDASTIHKKDSIVATLFKVILPRQKRTIKDIDKIVFDIEKTVKKGQCRLENIYGVGNQPCAIDRYYQDSVLVLIEFGCGDCSNIMSWEKYYFYGNALVCLKKYDVNYGYNPCWTKEDCKEYGITEKIKKESLKERNEKYYFLDSINISFKRTGNFNDTNYVGNDTLSQTIILRDATEYLNAKEPK